MVPIDYRMPWYKVHPHPQTPRSPMPSAARSKEDKPSNEDSVSSDGGFDQPLGDPEVLNEETRSASVDGSASIGVQLVSLGCALQWGPDASLTPDEAMSLQNDLAAVLMKYDAPDIPMSEEVRLALNVGGIAMRRVQADIGKRMAAEAGPSPADVPPEAPNQESAVNDITGAWKEGRGQERAGAQGGGPSVSRATRDILP